MKRYFTRITADHWVAKNKLAEEAKQLALKMERLIIHEDTLQSYRDAFIQSVKELNDKYPRCKPLKPIIWKIPYNRSHIERWSYSIPSVFNIEVVELQGEM